MLSGRLPVNSRLLLVKFWGSQNDTPIFDSMGVGALNSHIVQGSTVFLYVNWNSIIYFLRYVFSIFRDIILLLFSPK